MNRRLCVLAKHWTPGEAKTRLAATIGNDRAADVAHALLQATLSQFSEVAEEPCVVFTPSEKHEAFAQLAGPGWRLAAQGDGDLGRRMARCFRAEFRRREGPVVLIGADSPTLPREVLSDAYQELKTHDVVLGPTSDGGYYVVGARSEAPDIFEGVAWGTPDVWPQTLARCRTAGISCAVMPEWYDVDTLDDLRRLAGELASEGDSLDHELTQLRDLASAIIAERATPETDGR